ncbi:MAG: hypothetical protein JSV09_10405 [Thermoplasmata archaeon]|nr:MAG: hypothetical protein JSV09_10405 [Thermoplasmata archaeon]
MHRKYLGLSIILFLAFFLGCVDAPKSPVSKIPTILIDHIEETEETKVFVHGIENHLFSNITIEINDVRVTENFTYELHAASHLHKFMLNVTVWEEKKEYEYRGNFTVIEDDDQKTLEIQDIRHEDSIKRSFPYTIIMERKE